MGVRTPNYIKKLFFDVSYGISNRNISINILKGRTNTISCGRTPHRVRELKLHGHKKVKGKLLSHPSQGAGVEIAAAPAGRRAEQSHPSQGAGVEISDSYFRIATG